MPTPLHDSSGSANRRTDFFLSRGTARDRFLAIIRGSFLREDQSGKI
jgi:hypothetical protein